MTEYFKEHNSTYINYLVYFPWTKVKPSPNPIGINQCITPTDFFNKLWKNEIWEILADPKKITSKIRKNEYLSISYLKRFFGAVLMKGAIGLIAIEDLYGSPHFSLDFEGKKGLLPREVYFEISGKLKIDLKPIHPLLVGSFQEAMKPGYWVCIDEIRIPAHHFECENKSYNPRKPDPWAIESKSLHDSSKYLLHFNFPLDAEKKSPEDCVDIFSDYLKTTGRNHHITMDSNFLSAEDVPLIGNKGLECTVCCSKNRPAWIWKQGLVKNLPDGYTRVASHPEYITACTKNQGFVNLASNLYTVKDDEELYDPLERRHLLEVYDQTKGYADQFGRLAKAYFPNVTFKNYNLTLLVGWLVYATTNAYILYTFKYNALSHREFVVKIAKDLLLTE